MTTVYPSITLELLLECRAGPPCRDTGDHGELVVVSADLMVGNRRLDMPGDVEAWLLGALCEDVRRATAEALDDATAERWEP